jgi:hypothetical protein
MSGVAITPPPTRTGAAKGLKFGSAVKFEKFTSEIFAQRLRVLIEILAELSDIFFSPFYCVTEQIRREFKFDLFERGTARIIRIPLRPVKRGRRRCVNVRFL